MSLSLTVMALVLSWNSNKLAHQQNEIMIKESLPEFVIDKHYEYDVSLSKYTTEILSIYNKGEIASEIHGSTAVFFNIEYFENCSLIKNCEYRNVVIPVSGYYEDFIHHGSINELVMTIQGINNNLRVYQLNIGLQDICRQNGSSCFVGLDRYLMLSYKDKFEKSHMDYYYIENVGDGYIIDDKKGISVFNKFREMYKNNVIELVSINPRQLYSLMLKKQFWVSRNKNH